MKKKAVRCLLLDLDDTLLKNSWKLIPDVLLRTVFKLRSQMGTVRTFKTMRSIGKARFGNGGQAVNHERFLQAFKEISALTTKESELFFDQIFPNILRDCHRHFEPILAAQQFLSNVPNHVTLVLATNPVLNEVCTNLRIGWAGLQISDFKLITHSQNMRHSKPQSQYYDEILARLENDGITREECLFIGNDPVNDGAAIKSGISTVLVSSGSRPLKLMKKGKYNSFLYTSSWSSLPKLIEFEQGQ